MTNHGPTPPVAKPRRWYQFSLRTLVVVVVIVSMALGLFAARLQRARRQAEAVAVLQKHGYVMYDYAYSKVKGQRQYDPNAESVVPRWLVNLLREDFFHDVFVVATVVDDQSSDSHDRICKAVKQLHRLKELHIGADPGIEFNLDRLAIGRDLEEFSLAGQCRVDSLGPVRKLPKLKTLSLSEVTLTKEGLESISRMPQLSELSLKKIDLRRGDFSFVAKCQNLRSLDIDGILLTNHDLEDLSSMRQLEFLRLVRTQLTDGGLVHIGKLDQLISLDLSINDLTDDGVGHLSDSLRLLRLELRGTSVSGDGLRPFPRLETIDLSDTALSVEGLAKLVAFPELQTVVLTRTRVSAKGIQRFRTASPDVTLIGP